MAMGIEPSTIKEARKKQRRPIAESFTGWGGSGTTMLQAVWFLRCPSIIRRDCELEEWIIQTTWDI